MTPFETRRVTMVDTQVRPSDVTSLPIIDAMLKLPREEFLPVERRDLAYVGDNVPIAPGRVMLAPRTIAKMLETAKIRPEDVVLVVGAGYGYSAALAAELASRVVALEEDLTLARKAEEALPGYGVDLVSGPLTLGAKGSGPYDLILIEGGVEQVPDALTDQLNDGGRILALFSEDRLDTCRIAYKYGQALEWRSAFSASAPILQGFERTQEFAL